MFKTVCYQVGIVCIAMLGFGSLHATPPSSASDLPSSVLRANENAEDNVREMKRNTKNNPSVVIDYQGIREKAIDKNTPKSPSEFNYNPPPKPHADPVDEGHKKKSLPLPLKERVTDPLEEKDDNTSPKPTPSDYLITSEPNSLTDL